MKIKTKVFFCALLIIIGVELLGRYMGLTSYPLFYNSEKYEYHLKPNQNTIIFRNHFYTNEYSMRSRPINKGDSLAVLLIGDSVLNGGNLIDQDSLASTILEKKLTKELKRNIRVFNVSAKSWGPDNAAAFIEEYGLFNSDLIVLVVSSHDAHDNMTKKKIVGISPDHPDRNVLFAWLKLLEKVLPKLGVKLNSKKTDIHTEQTIAIEKEFNSGFQYFFSTSQKNKIPIMLFLHSELVEIKNNKLNGGGKEIVEFCEKKHISFINGLNYETPNMYLDNIHYNEYGQRYLANSLYPYLYAYMSKLGN